MWEVFEYYCIQPGFIFFSEVAWSYFAVVVFNPTKSKYFRYKYSSSVAISGSNSFHHTGSYCLLLLNTYARDVPVAYLEQYSKTSRLLCSSTRRTTSGSPSAKELSGGDVPMILWVSDTKIVKFVQFFLFALFKPCCDEDEKCIGSLYRGVRSY